jgi:hypothetical protein
MPDDGPELSFGMRGGLTITAVAPVSRA